MPETTFRVPDITDQESVQRITDGLYALDGVQHVDVNLETRLVSVKHDDAIEPEGLEHTIEAAGFSVADI